MNVITESLYDKPIVVFREYIQNSVDSIRRSAEQKKISSLCCKIWKDNSSLYFLDNGAGIAEADFEDKMIRIAMSEKNRINDIGYKGIGRLSGISYCNKLIFINILSYKKQKYQKYIIDSEKYRKIRWTPDFDSLEFSDAMNQIGEFSEVYNDIPNILNKYSNIFTEQDTGFLVILSQPNRVLNTIINKTDFINELGWLLPVKFKKELNDPEYNGLFSIFSEIYVPSNTVPALSYNITFNDQIIERPITKDTLRDYNCLYKIDRYATGFISFPKGKMTIDTKNDFKGIRLYLNNILLCDESELLPMLVQYGFLNHTMNELTQSVKVVGALIYITDKNNIYANARRTFIEITDNDSLDFLKLLAEIVERIYAARYAISKYYSFSHEQGELNEKVEKLKDVALESLQALSSQKINLDDSLDFQSPNEEDRRKAVKKIISKAINAKLSEYMSQLTDYHIPQDSAYESFKNWLINN